MKAGDLQLITLTASVYPKLLPTLLNIYRLGYKQAMIDSMKKRVSDLEWGINYGNEMLQNN